MSSIGQVEWRILKWSVGASTVVAHLIDGMTQVSLCGMDDAWGERVYTAPRVQCRNCVRVYKKRAYKQAGG